MPTTRVLVVHGSATQALLLKHLLEQRGLESETADSVDAAVAALALRAPDAVLVDAASLGPDAAARLRAGSRVASVLVMGAAEGAPAPGVQRVATRDAEGVADEVRALLQRRETPPTAAEVFRRAKVLVVDDSVTYREFLRLELEAEGCTVTVARNADEAISALAEHDLDCVIIDLVMPGTSGTELCETFDRFRRRRGLIFQIVILTSQEGDEQLRASLSAGADDFIGKSRPMEVFKLRLMALVRRKYLAEDALALRQA